VFVGPIRGRTRLEAGSYVA